MLTPFVLLFILLVHSDEGQMGLDTVMHLCPTLPHDGYRVSPCHSPGDIFLDAVSLIKEQVIQQKAIAFTSAQLYASRSERLLACSQFFFPVTQEYSIER